MPPVLSMLLTCIEV
jgi:hypothetical protein